MVVYSLFVVAPIVCWGLMLGACFVLQYFGLFLHWGRERAGCFAFVAF